VIAARICLIVGAGFILSAAAFGASCDSLTALVLPDVKIKSAADVAAGSFSPQSGSSGAMNVPAFCRVAAVATPSSDSVINFEVWIPPADAWNGKFQGVGNAGWSGTIAYAALGNALRRGYAAASTDAGHTGDDLKFANGHPEKIVDWAYRAVHVMTDASKLIVRAKQGRWPAYSYFTGCSTGGAQGLTEAQRYPDDYDGVWAGDPGNERINRVAGYLWSWAAAHQDPASNIPPAKLTAMTKAAVDACDALDGVKDGVIDDPRRCRFDPGALLCRGADDGTCLTAAQVQTAKKIYEGPRNPRTGEQIFPGEPPGSENFGEGGNAGWRSYIMDPKEAMRLDFWRYFVFDDPNWDWRTFDWDRDLAFARRKLPMIDAVNPDLTAFKSHGGKIVMYLAWDDPIHISQSSLNYYENVERAMGGAPKTADFFRLFLAPGMGHCSGGPGPNTLDALAPLETWVEHGGAPEKIIASRLTNRVADRTRPLCAYPQVARWTGKGSTDDAANFTCAMPAKTPSGSK
jgi:Tannase and feruloyl esterase